MRERARIDEVVREYVPCARPAAAASRGCARSTTSGRRRSTSPPARGFYYCFGCGEGGDVITFLQKIDHLTFAEAVEKLADKVGVQLRYEEGGAAPGRQQGQRTRLVDAHKARRGVLRRAARGRRRPRSDGASSTSAGSTRRRPSTSASATRRRGWDDADHPPARQGLHRRGAAERRARGRRAARVVRPLPRPAGVADPGLARRRRSASARASCVEDDDGPKYLNTPETPIYKKSQVLYGLDLAKREIARSQQAVIVEGYTDVMACHLAGVDDRDRDLRHGVRRRAHQGAAPAAHATTTLTGEVVFTFDGDAAGQKAALRAFARTRSSSAQTFVAVEPNGLDPCDLRTGEGRRGRARAGRRPGAAVRVRDQRRARRLRPGQRRRAGSRAARRRLPSSRGSATGRCDRSTRGSLAGWLGMEPQAVSGPWRGPAGPSRHRAEATVARRSRRAPRRRIHPRCRGCPAPTRATRSPRSSGKRSRSRCRSLSSRASWVDAMEPAAFTAPAYRAGLEAVAAAGGAASGLVDRPWVEAVAGGGAR